MAVYIWCEIVCANCSASTAGEYTAGAVRRRPMKAEARKNGFIFVGNEAFCGELCAKSWDENFGDKPTTTGEGGE